ncbi:MAG: HlyD family type I secretion periplasmic adaptor subunit [Aquabacterium sp.]|nr:HlyD family type I secretion periplasmic adaptor subunit [Aquabacterium sp.]
MSAALQWLRRWGTVWNPYDPARLHDKGTGVVPVVMDEARTRRSMVWVITLAFAAFLVWSVTAPLDGGVVVSGSVIVSGNRKAVQHPAGGVVVDILVQEGAMVRQGDVVIRVNPLSSEASLGSVEGEYINALATEARLLAERSGSPIRWKPELDAFGVTDPRVAEAKALQLQLFNSRREELQNQVRILQEQAASQQAEADGQVKVLAEKRGQLRLVAEEATNTVQLAKEGYVSESRANEVLRAKSSLDADLASLQANVAKTRSSISATQLQIAQLRSVFMKEIDGQLSEIQKTREGMHVRVASLTFDRALTEVRAPASGTVVGLKTSTVGGVISAGQVLMEILPEGGQLIVEAKVPTASIDKVRMGLPADVRFSAFNQTTTPVVPGVVRLVGADKLTDPNGAEYYLAQVETTAEGLRLLGENRIQAGMPADIVVKVGERSFMSYLVKPLTDRIAISFKD